MIIAQRSRSASRAASSFDLRAWAAPAYLTLCILLGGASAEGAVANGLLQFAAVALIAWTTIDRRSDPLSPPGRALMIIAACAAALAILQLLPLPPMLWQGLPGRAVVAEGFRLLERPAPWLPLSLTPWATLASGLSLLPPIAVALLVLRMPERALDALRLTVPIAAMLSVLLGLAQLVGGPNSPLYLYDVTNRGSPVGFFANVNHQATLLLAAIPFLAALALKSKGRRSSRATVTGRQLLIGGAALLLLIGLALTGSVAAYLIAVPVTLASWLLLRHDRGRKLSATSGGIMLTIGVGLILLAIYSPFASNIGTSFIGPLSRPEIYRTSLSAALAYMPFGGGLGSFPDVYPMFENPAEVTAVYVNHAHSDLMEIAVDAGVCGLALTGALLFWWMRRVHVAWQGQGERVVLERAAVVASAAILVHSLVDYPLRTAAIGALAAALLAILAGRGRVARQVDGEAGRQRHMSVD